MINVQLVTDLEARKKFVAENKLCFRCLQSGHIRRNCRYRRDCYTCKSTNHHTELCDKNNREPVEKSLTTVVTSKTSVLLQTAIAKISKVGAENNEISVKVLFDSGSQRSYVSKKIVNKLKLNPINTQKMVIKTFGDASDTPKFVNEYEFFLKGADGKSKVFLKGFSVPLICSPISGHTCCF